MTQIIDIPFGKGEGKAILKDKITELWQKQQDEDTKGRAYCRIQKTIRIKSIQRKNRREEVILIRYRFDHTGLNKTLFQLRKKIIHKYAWYVK